LQDPVQSIPIRNTIPTTKMIALQNKDETWYMFYVDELGITNFHPILEKPNKRDTDLDAYKP
jgi:hypothetical protein